MLPVCNDDSSRTPEVILVTPQSFMLSGAGAGFHIIDMY